MLNSHFHQLVDHYISISNQLQTGNTVLEIFRQKEGNFIPIIVAYLSGSTENYQWETQSLEAGKYTAIITQDTGPVGGEIYGEAIITIK